MNSLYIKWFKLYIRAFLFFLSLDLFWNGFVVRSFVMRQLGVLLRLSPAGFFTPIVPAALIAWVALVLGIVIFVYPVVLSASTYHKPLLIGALYGLIVYSVYEATNFAIVAKWPLLFSVVDVAWGTLLCSLTALFGWITGL